MISLEGSFKASRHLALIVGKMQSYCIITLRYSSYTELYSDVKHARAAYVITKNSNHVTTA